MRLLNMKERRETSDGIRLSKKKRNKRGFVMTAAEFLISIPLFLAGSTVLCDLGEACVYRERVSSILSETADYAVNMPANEDPVKSNKVKLYLEKSCSDSRLSMTNLQIAIEDTTVGKAQAVTVKLSTRVPFIAGSFSLSPFYFQDQATSIYPANRVCATIAIAPSVYSGAAPNGLIYLPVISPQKGTPVWQFPHDPTLDNLAVINAAVPSGPRSNSNSLLSLY